MVREVSVLERLRLLFHTVIHLRWRQIVYRCYYRIRRAQVIRFPSQAVNTNSFSWISPVFAVQSFFPDNTVRYLNEEGRIEVRSDWNQPYKSKLWLYNLHYFDDLNAHGAERRVSVHRQWIHRWINENPAPKGNGWEPYPTSLRLVNWIKWCNREKVNDDLIVRSIVQQADALNKRIEYHILGNHLFANAKALVFAGAFLSGAVANRSLRRGLRILKREVHEQFLTDGGHFELSPMYHSILLWDLFDLINLAQTTKYPVLEAPAGEWRCIAEKALKWLQVMTHPDGEVAFFNDSALGIAPKLADQVEYARQLGVACPAPLSQSHILLGPSGYSRINMPQHVLFVDHAPVGPDYQPGHAHADSLSIEWSVGAQRVLVNSGTSVYSTSPERLRQRQTAAHNTVVVDGENSSEVWSGFRVARRANANIVRVTEGPGQVTLVVEQDGFRRLPGKVRHEREIVASDNGLRIVDRLSGNFKKAEVYFHLHPAVRAVLSDGDRDVELLMPDDRIIKVHAKNRILLQDSSWHPGFGVSVLTKKVIVSFQTPENEVTFSLGTGHRL